MEPDGIYRHTPTLLADTRIRCLAFDSGLSGHIGDALTLLSRLDEWVEVGDGIQDIIDAASVTVESFYNDMLIGSVFPWLVNPPDGWLLLDGTTYASADYPELSALLPTHLISGSNFTLPDVEDTFPYGVLDEDDGSQVAGSNILNLTVGQLPAHTHTYNNPVAGVETIGAGAPAPSIVSATPATATSSTGSGDDIDKRPLRFGLVYAVYAGRV